MKSYIFQVQSPRGLGYAEVIYQPGAGFNCTRTTPDLKCLLGPVDAEGLKSLIYRIIPRTLAVDWLIATIPSTGDFYQHAKRAFRKLTKKKVHTTRAVRGAGWDAYSGRHGVGAFK